MIRQKTLWNLQPIESDIVYTPENIAVDIIEWCQPSGVLLDPCAGDWVFYRHLPEPKDWCEIEKSKDFFDYNKNVDWIIGNPPYSIFDEFLFHSFEIADNVVYIIPTNKLFQRVERMEMIEDYGGIYGMRIYGSGQKVGFDFGFSVGAFHIKKSWKGKTEISFWKG